MGSFNSQLIFYKKKTKIVNLKSPNNYHNLALGL